ncbi:MAG: RNA polymerase sigma factor [Ferruginibacter sp.]
MIVEDVNQVNEWIKNYSDTFFNYIHARVKDKTAAKDILQETFIAAWKSRASFKKEAAEKTWLYSILKNKLVDHYRMQSRAITDLADNNYSFDNRNHWTEMSAPKQ